MFIRVKEDGEGKSESGTKFKAKTIWAYKKMQAAFNYILILKCFVPIVYSETQLFLAQTLTEIIPYSIKY